MLKDSQAAQKGPDARRRPRAAREAYSLYVERAAEGAALPQMGLFQQPASSCRDERVAAALVCPLLLGRVPIHERPHEHRVGKASHLVLDGEE